MRLELKHLATYLPYGLKYQSSMDKPFDEYGKNPIWTFDGINKVFDNYCLITKENNDAYEITSCKPILHPLSDLTKEIEVNGEKFVPSERIAVHLFDYDFLEMVIDRKNTNGIPFWVIKKLLEWHFDIYGLIEKGLAIDINTL